MSEKIMVIVQKKKKKKKKRSILFKLLVESTSVLYFNKKYKQKYGATSTVAMTSKQCIVVPTMEDIYATIKLQVLSHLLTSASTRKKSATFYF
jgi:hypothetical protein